MTGMYCYSKAPVEMPKISASPEGTPRDATEAGDAAELIGAGDGGTGTGTDAGRSNASGDAGDRDKEIL